MKLKFKKIIFLLSLVSNFALIECAAPAVFNINQAIQKINDSIGRAKTLSLQNNFVDRTRYFNELIAYLSGPIKDGCPGFDEQIKKQTLQKMDETAFAISTFALENIPKILAQVEECLKETAQKSPAPAVSSLAGAAPAAELAKKPLKSGLKKPGGPKKGVQFAPEKNISKDITPEEQKERAESTQWSTKEDEKQARKEFYGGKEEGLPEEEKKWQDEARESRDKATQAHRELYTQEENKLLAEVEQLKEELELAGRKVGVQLASQKNAAREEKIAHEQQSKNPRYNNQLEAEKAGWTFKSDNKFVLGEYVMVPRSGNPITYSLGTITQINGPNSFNVGVLDDKWEISGYKNLAPSLIGKTPRYNNQLEAEKAGWTFKPENKLALGEYIMVPRSGTPTTYSLGTITQINGPNSFQVAVLKDNWEFSGYKNLTPSLIGKNPNFKTPIKANKAVQSASEEKVEQEQKMTKEEKAKLKKFEYLTERERLIKQPYKNQQEAEKNGWTFNPKEKLSIGEYVVVLRAGKAVLGKIKEIQGRFFVVQPFDDNPPLRYEAKEIGVKPEPKAD